MRTHVKEIGDCVIAHIHSPVIRRVTREFLPFALELTEESGLLDNGFALKVRNHSWTQSVQGAIATWSVTSMRYLNES